MKKDDTLSPATERSRSMPKGWEVKKLGEIAFVKSGGTPSRVKKEYWGGSIAWYSSGELNDLYTQEPERYINDLAIKNSNAKLFPKGSLLIGMYDTAALKMSILDRDATFNQAIAGVKPSDKINLKFILHSINAIKVDLLNLRRGVRQKNLSLEKIKDIPIPLPPLAEQQRIVATLDKAFAAIAKAKANTEQNLKNAKELFESYLQSVFADKGKGNNGEALETLCEFIVDCEHKTAPTQETGYPSIRTPNIGKGVLILDNVNRVSEKTYKEWTRRAIPMAGDLILAREAPAGNVAVIPENLEVCLGQRTVLIRPKKDKFNSKYLASLLLSKDVQEKLLEHSRGATVAHINMKDIRAFKIYNLSPLKEQQSIVKKLDALSAETKKLEAIYQQKINNLDELKKSILQKAFSGEL